MSVLSVHAQRLSVPAQPARRAPVHRRVVADGPLSVPFTLLLDGGQVEAKLVATISSSMVLGEGSPTLPSRPITVQEIVGAHVEVQGTRLPIADDALYTLMKARGVELDWPFSSPTEVTRPRLLGLLGARPMVTVGTEGFRLRKRREDKRFHSGVVAIHHPERVY